MNDKLTLEYQQRIAEAILVFDPRYKHRCFKDRLALNGLALCGEAGEITNKIKKYNWYKDIPEAQIKAELKDELGDVLYHIAQLATEIDCTLDELLLQSLGKLNTR